MLCVFICIHPVLYKENFNFYTFFPFIFSLFLWNILHLCLLLSNINQKCFTTLTDQVRLCNKCRFVYSIQSLVGFTIKTHTRLCIVSCSGMKNSQLWDGQAVNAVHLLRSLWLEVEGVWVGGVWRVCEGKQPSDWLDAPQLASLSLAL